MLGRMQRKGNPRALLVGVQTGAAALENIWRFLKKLKVELPYDPAILSLGRYPKETKTPAQNHICTHVFIATLFTMAKTRRQPK